MKVAIFGASGFLGHNLVRHLLSETDWSVRAVSRSPKPFNIPPRYAERFESTAGDVMREADIAHLLRDIDVAYYFVHLMGQRRVDFYTGEQIAAKKFAEAAHAAGIKRIVYMGGLGDEHTKLSKHLLSRHKTGDGLSSTGVPVVELRASMIIGYGSVAFDIITNLVDKLPVMLLPLAANTLTQPIALDDVLRYLTAAATVDVTGHLIVEIGGPEVMSYEALYRSYAKWSGYRRILFRVPVIPPWLEGKWLDLFTPSIHARIGRIMVDSMTSPMVVMRQDARTLFPNILVHRLDHSFTQARNEQRRVGESK